VPWFDEFPINVVRATINGLQGMSTPAEIAQSAARQSKKSLVNGHSRIMAKKKSGKKIGQEAQGHAGAWPVIGTRGSHRATVAWPRLRRINHTVELEDTPAVRA